MEKYEKRTLDKSLVLLTDNLQPADVMPYLIAKEVMCHRDFEEIEAKQTRESKVQVFVRILQTRGNKAFAEFVNALNEGVHKGLASSLRDEARKLQIEEKGVSKFAVSDRSYIFLEYLIKMAKAMGQQEVSQMCKSFKMSYSEEERIVLSACVVVEFLSVALERDIFTNVGIGPMKAMCRNCNFDHLERICSEYEEKLRLPDLKITATPSFLSVLQKMPFSLFYGKNQSNDEKVRFYTKCKSLDSLFTNEYHETILHKLDERDNSIHVKVPSLKALQKLSRDIKNKELGEKLIPILHDNESSTTASGKATLKAIQLANDPSNYKRVLEVLSKGGDCRDRKFAVPLCLPSNFSWNQQTKSITVKGNRPRGDLKVCQEGVDLLKSIGEDLVIVVCITGPARSGKSFFLSQFDPSVDFEVGHSVESKTTGIWIAVGQQWINIDGNKAKLVLLDAEGLDAVATADKAGNDKWDRKVFSLCTLLSSHLIYNSRGVPNNNDLDKLGLIAQFSESIFYNTRSPHDANNEDEFRKVAPHFLWLVRDALLEPEIEGKSVSWNEFVRKSVLSKNSNDISSSRNAVREAIAKTFQSVSAFALESPTFDKTVIRNLSLPSNSNKINPQFLQGIEDVKGHILHSPQLKKIKGGFVSGEQMVFLLNVYLSAVNEQCDKLQIETMWDSSIKLQLDLKREQCLREYKKCMCNISYPSSVEHITTMHETALTKMQDLFETSTNRFDESVKSTTRKSLLDDAAKELTLVEAKNEGESYRYCQVQFSECQVKFFDLSESELSKLSCDKLLKLKDQMLEAYRSSAKGPMIQKVQDKNEDSLEKTLSSYRQNILKRTLQLANDSYAECLFQAKKLIPCEMERVVEDHNTIAKRVLALFNEKCNNCNDCNACRQTLTETLSRNLEEIKRSNELKSKALCESLTEQLISHHLHQLMASVSNRSYNEFVRAKTNIFDEYERRARGPAKAEVKAKCEVDVETQLKVAERQIIDSALNNAIDQYEKDLNEVMYRGPYDEEELIERECLMATESNKIFYERCQGIFKTNLRTNEELLKKSLKDRKTLFILKNEQTSFNFCEQVMEECLKQCDGGLSDIANNFSLGTLELIVDPCDDLFLLQRKIENTYKKRSKGPMKDTVGKRLRQLIEDRLFSTKKIIADHTLIRSLNQCKDRLEAISEELPLEEGEIFEKFASAAKTSKCLFQERCGKIDAQILVTYYKILEEVTKNRNARLVANNVKKSFEHCYKTMVEVLENFQKNLKTITLETSVDHLYRLKEERIRAQEDFERKVKGPAKHIYKKHFIEKLDFHLEDTQTCLRDESFKALLNEIRQSLFQYLESGPYCEERIDEICEQEKKKCVARFRTMNRENDKTKLQANESMLKSTIEDITEIVKSENKKMSFNQCQTVLSELLLESEEDFQQKINDYRHNKRLQEETNYEEIVFTIKDRLLRKFDEKGKGTAKEEVREICKDKIQRQLVSATETVLLDSVQFGKDEYLHQSQIIFEDCPLEEHKLQNLLNEGEEKVLKYFNKTMGKKLDDSSSNETGNILDEDFISKNLHSLKQFIDSTKACVISENKVSSLAQCKETMQTILKQRKEFKDKSKMKESYDAQARGPMKDVVWGSFEEEINLYFMRWYTFLQKRFKEW